MAPPKNASTACCTLTDDGAVLVRLDGSPLTLSDVELILTRRLRVELSDAIWQRIDAGRRAVERIAAADAPAYGVNTGFGNLCTTRIAPDQLNALQTNLILSHAVGVGPQAPPEIVRLMLLFKINALAFGVSGVARTTVEALIRLLEHDILPVVPTQGSLGASGDLAPLAHMVLPLLGRGRVRVNGEHVDAKQALEQVAMTPITLGPKEGLALINGTQFMSAYAALIAARARTLARHADLIASMSLEGWMGSIKPFDERLHEYRPHPGAVESAANVRRLMAGSEILESHARCPRVQDPYSFRCVPQVHGASRDALRHAAQVIETEINAATDNPLVFDNGDVISGGAFHGQPLALALDYLAIALAELGSISERRIYHLLSGSAGLPTMLTPQPGLHSGYMLAHVTAAALVSENKGLCTPASVDTIPTALEQEDHVSMGARAAVKCHQILQNAETVLAIEQMCAAQALDFRLPLAAGLGPRTAHAELRRHVLHADRDRLFGTDVERSLALLRDGTILAAVEANVGTLK